MQNSAVAVFGIIFVGEIEQNRQMVSKIVLSKDPVLRYQVGTKKIKTSRY